MKIKNIFGQEIYDSRGRPTVMATVFLEDGSCGCAKVPSGASTGAHEAHELRDADGFGVKSAIKNINEIIAPALEGSTSCIQHVTDSILCTLDGTENKQKLGANAILAVSLACARASAQSLNLPLYRYLGGLYSRILPLTMMNILNGGAHAANNIDIQEFMVAPVGAESFAQGMEMCVSVYRKLKDLVGGAGVGDEGGFAPMLDSDADALKLIVEAIDNANLKGQMAIALDMASSEWYSHGAYHLPKRKLTLSRNELCAYIATLCERFPIYSVEDGMAEDDFEGWELLTKRLGSSVQLVGDDLFVTSRARLKDGIEKGIANAILIKPNQIGTLSETLDTVRLAQKSGYGVILSHRSGETEDSFIADLAVATNCGQIKAGAPARSERVCKYNRLLEIENEGGMRYGTF